MRSRAAVPSPIPGLGEFPIQAIVGLILPPSLVSAGFARTTGSPTSPQPCLDASKNSRLSGLPAGGRWCQRLRLEEQQRAAAAVEAAADAAAAAEPSLAVEAAADAEPSLGAYT